MVDTATGDILTSTSDPSVGGGGGGFGGGGSGGEDGRVGLPIVRTILPLLYIS